MSSLDSLISKQIQVGGLQFDLRGALNLVAGPGVGITGQDDKANRRTNVTITVDTPPGTSIIGSARLVATSDIPNLASPPADIDGVTIANGDSIALAGQNDSTQNGIYTKTVSGLVRRADLSESHEFTHGQLFAVREGNVFAYSLWQIQFAEPMVLGTTTIGVFQVGGGGGGDATSLLGIDLDATTFGAPNDGDVLTYDSVSGELVLEAPVAGGSNADALRGVNLDTATVGTPTTGFLIGYDGTDYKAALLVNANVAAGAAIAGTKINPNFGSQAVTTTSAGTFGAVLSVNPTNNALGAEISARKNRAGAIVQVNDEIGYFQAQAWDGSAYQTTAKIVAVVYDTPGAGDVPTRLDFQVGPATGSLATAVSMFTDSMVLDGGATSFSVGRDNTVYCALDNAGSLHNLAFWATPSAWNAADKVLFIGQFVDAPSAAVTDGAFLWATDLVGGGELTTHRARALDYLAVGADPVASAGSLRLPNNSSIYWRNAADSADYGITLTAANLLAIVTGGGCQIAATGGITLSNACVVASTLSTSFGGHAITLSNLILSFSNTTGPKVIRVSAGVAASATGSELAIQGHEQTGNTATTGGKVSIVGGTVSGAGGTHTGGAVEINGGDATGGSGTRTGGALILRGGTGATANGVLSLRDGATERITINGTGIGFFGATPIAKPTVSGSRGGNAALADLLTELATLGLITDSSSA